MTITTESRNRREQLLAMIWDLQTNRVILDKLVKCYGVFLFTGGDVPRDRWNLVAITSYLQCPYAAACISTADAERYQQLAMAIMDLGDAITSGARPRTLRCRYAIAEDFGRDSSEIQALGSSLESTMTKLVDDLKPLPLLSETESAMKPVEPGFSSKATIGTTSGGDL